MIENLSAGAQRLTERLAGPAGPELGCEECFDALDSYVELELAGADADAAVPRMLTHLRGCPACSGDHDSLLALLLSDSEDARQARPGAGRAGSWLQLSIAGATPACPVAASNACATLSSGQSARLRPTSCKPTGRPAAVKPAGTEMAGSPVAEIRYAEAIQSR